MMRINFTAVFSAALICSAAVAGAAAFTQGNLVVVKVGDGTAYASAAAPVVLEEYTQSGTFVQSVALPTSVSGLNGRLTLALSSTSEGQLTLSPDGKYLAMAGYDAAVNTAAVSGATANAKRTVAIIDMNASIDTTTLLPQATNFNASSVRAAVTSDGTNIWVTGTGSTGSTAGVRFATKGQTTDSVQLATTPTNVRSLGIYKDSGNADQLYATSGSGTFVNVFTAGTGLQTTSGQTATSLSGLPTSGASPYAFVFTDSSTLFVAEDTNAPVGIRCYTRSGSTWSLQGTVTTTTARGTAIRDYGSSVDIFSTSGSLLQKGTGYAKPAMTGGSVATLQTAATNYVFRGIVLIPDVTNPASAASITATSQSSTSIAVDYTASDSAPANTGNPSGLNNVSLMVRTPGSGVYVDSGLTPQTTGSGTFTYTAAAGPGLYEFYTVSGDKFGNTEAAPGSADDAITLTTGGDTTPPVSSASITASATNAASISVDFTASDATAVASTDLYVKTPGSGSFVDTGLTPLTGTSGTFVYTYSAGEGVYEFYTISTDTLSNVEVAPGTADDSIVVDTTRPTASFSVVTTPRTTNAGTVTLTFLEPVTGVNLADFALTRDLDAPGVTGTLTPLSSTVYTLDVSSDTALDGLYALSLKFSGTGIVDAAGNEQNTGAVSIFRVDTTAPVSSVTLADPTVVGTSIVLPFTSTDTAGSGLASTALFVKVPGGSFVNSGLTPSAGNFTYTAAADGVYEFYTVGTDNASNVEAAPASADVVATVNTVANSTLQADFSAGQLSNSFPMESALDVDVTFSAVTTPGALTVSRSAPRATVPGGLNSARLINQSWTMTKDGSLAFGTATVVFGYDDERLGSLTEGDINAAFSVDGATITSHSGASVSVNTSANTVTVTGVVAFSDWFIGNNDATVSDWSLLND